MKQRFRATKLNARSMAHLNTINAIIEDYQAQGYTLTLRQLYYQLVSRNVIPNSDREYKKISRVLTEGRMAGLVDWDAIEDRLRQPSNVYHVADVKDALEDTYNQYRLDRQVGQNTFVEVWVEKDAISAVLKRVTQKYGVNILVNRGYGSVTAMHDAYSRYREALHYGSAENVVVIYLGDHDPSGLDMIRDIYGRVSEMLREDDLDDRFVIKPVALTMKQIRKYNPPPNPAKLSDSRAEAYIEKHGAESWEVDALPPEVLHKLLEKSILSEIDSDVYEKVLNRERNEKAIIRTFIDSYDDGNDDE